MCLPRKSESLTCRPFRSDSVKSGASRGFVPPAPLLEASGPLSEGQPPSRQASASNHTLAIRTLISSSAPCRSLEQAFSLCDEAAHEHEVSVETRKLIGH